MNDDPTPRQIFRMDQFESAVRDNSIQCVETIGFGVLPLPPNDVGVGAIAGFALDSPSPNFALLGVGGNVRMCLEITRENLAYALSEVEKKLAELDK